MKKFFLLIAIIGFCQLNAQTPAFPTAEGFGKFSTGGRGGKVVYVTNLEDYIAYNSMETPIPGSFRWALTQYPGEPLTILFKVSGTVMLKPYIVSGKNQNDIRSSRGKLTIAGQSAPGDGICFRNSKLNFGGSSNVIMRNLRFRIGENAADSTFIPGGSMGIENAYNIILDHCVFGWSGEENLTMYDNRFTTVQWSMFHEGLWDDGHGKGNRSYGGQVGGINATYHHNFFAHNQSRSPRLNGARTDNEIMVFIDYINNVNFNWGGSGAAYGGDLGLGKLRSHTCNFVGNYYKPGPASSTSSNFFRNYILNGANLPVWHLTGNKMTNSTTATDDNWKAFEFSWSGTAGTALPTKVNVSSDTLLAPPKSIVYGGAWIGYDKYKLKIETADMAYDNIVQKVGTINRDSVEKRLIRELQTGTVNFKASKGVLGIIDKSFDAEGYLPYESLNAPADQDSDGMPDQWESDHGLNPADASDGNLVTLSGFTALEVYLNELMGESIELKFSTGMHETKVQTFNVYPTLCSKILNIQSSDKIEKADLFSIGGKRVLAWGAISNQIISLENLNIGSYILRLTAKDGSVQNFKIIKI